MSRRSIVETSEGGRTEIDYSSLPGVEIESRIRAYEERYAATLRDYVVTEQIVACFKEALGFIRSALDGKSSKAAYLHGSFGSGKSHFMAVLHLLHRVFKPGEFRANEFWNAWVMPANRRRVLALLGRWKELTDKYQCTLAQLVIAWTAAQPGVTHVLAGGRNLAQVTENAKADELKLALADIKRIREDVIALGEPAPAGKAAGA